MKKWKGNKDGPMVVKYVNSNRKGIKSTYNETNQTHQTLLYNKMVNIMCPHLQFNPATELRIADLKRSYGVPLDWDPNQPSASFHIRRGDKITNRESSKYDGAVFVHKLKQITPNATFEHCFVATDDYRAVVEIRKVLANEITICRNLHTLTQHDETGHRQNKKTKRKKKESRDHQTLQFMAELQSMITTTYFVGTFNSNVGALTSILRGCHGRSDDYPHFTRSYGVDIDNWYFR
jgi:hypothetical protein